MSSHVLPLRVYYGVFFGLMGLTALTTWIAYLDLGAMNDVVALSIASVKAVFVLLYFMHVRYSGRLIWVFAAGGFFWLVIFFVLILSDYATRIPVPGWDG